MSKTITFMINIGVFRINIGVLGWFLSRMSLWDDFFSQNIFLTAFFSQKWLWGDLFSQTWIWDDFFSQNMTFRWNIGVIPRRCQAISKALRHARNQHAQNGRGWPGMVILARYRAHFEHVDFGKAWKWRPLRTKPHFGTRPRIPRIPRIPRKRCQQLLLGASLPHAPGARMTGVTTNSLKWVHRHP